MSIVIDCNRFSFNKMSYQLSIISTSQPPFFRFGKVFTNNVELFTLKEFNFQLHSTIQILIFLENQMCLGIYALFHTHFFLYFSLLMMLIFSLQNFLLYTIVCSATTILPIVFLNVSFYILSSGRSSKLLCSISYKV